MTTHLSPGIRSSDRGQPDRTSPGRLVAIHAASSPGEVRVVVMADQILVDYGLWRPGSPDGVGDVCQGRVTALVPAMAGAFVALTGSAARRTDTVEGFLPDSQGAKGITEGAIVTVRITRAAQGGKGPRLSTRIDCDPRGKDTELPRRGIDPLRELAARYPGAIVLVDDLALAASLRADLSERVIAVERKLITRAEVALKRGRNFE